MLRDFPLVGTTAGAHWFGRERTSTPYSSRFQQRVCTRIFQLACKFLVTYLYQKPGGLLNLNPSKTQYLTPFREQGFKFNEEFRFVVHIPLSWVSFRITNHESIIENTPVGRVSVTVHP